MADGDEGHPRDILAGVLQPLLPPKWIIVTDERKRDDTDRTEVRLSQRTIRRHPVASTGVHQIGFTVTITVPGIDLTAAEYRLDQDVDAFLFALDTAGIGWDVATKAIYDGRLGYQMNVEVESHRAPETTEQAAAAAAADTDTEYGEE